MPHMDSPFYMLRCIELASKGLGRTAPNPMVGSVIVNDGQIVGEGYHEQYGALHAEVNAIRSVTDQSLLQTSTLYVNLEPCSYFGKTPPCADLIIEKKIPRVVVGAFDPNPKVSGQGMARLRDSGVDVTERILENECRELNRRFYTFHEKTRPYVILKWAETADGFIARSDFSSKWISSEASRKLVHEWRAEESAIMVGTNTAKLDNPSLTVRGVSGKNPLRIVIDRKLSLPKTHNIFDQQAPLIVFNENVTKKDDDITYSKVPFDHSLLNSILTDLHSREIQSVIIEGGATLLNSFIDQGLWDEARVFTAKSEFGSGISAPKLQSEKLREEISVDIDALRIFRN